MRLRSARTCRGATTVWLPLVLLFSWNPCTPRPPNAIPCSGCTSSPAPHTLLVFCRDASKVPSPQHKSSTRLPGSIQLAMRLRSARTCRGATTVWLTLVLLLSWPCRPAPAWWRSGRNNPAPRHDSGHRPEEMRRDHAGHRFRHTLQAARSEEHTSELQSLMRIQYAVLY